jgi:putative redox protein
MSQINTTVSYKADNEYTATNQSGNELHFDMYGADEKHHFSPMEALLSSLAACAAVDLVAMIKKRRKQLDDLQISCSGQRKTDDPKAFTHITLHFVAFSPDLEQEEFEKLVKLAATKYCSVSGSLNPEIAVKHVCEIRR